jgi:hypothetical protein
MGMRHVFQKLAILFTTVGMVGCQSTDFYEKVKVDVNATPGDSQNDFTTGGTTSGGSTSGGTSGGGSQGVITKTENFVASDGKADILWVVDNSGSMSDKQVNLANNVDAIANGFSSQGLDFKMAVTTTDATGSNCGMTRNGSANLTTAYMDSNFAGFVSSFESAIEAGQNGSGNEKTFVNMKCFLDLNPSFVRTNSNLVVMHLGDEEDQSLDSVASYMDYLKSFKPDAPGMAKFYSICDKNDIQANRGLSDGCTRLAEAAALTNGATFDIFSTHYSDEILSLIETLKLITSGFPLGTVPTDEASIVVSVDGSVVQGWTYDSVNNLVNLSVVAGSQVSISYQ